MIKKIKVLKLLEKITINTDYESVGRRFESCRAHHEKRVGIAYVMPLYLSAFSD